MPFKLPFIGRPLQVSMSCGRRQLTSRPPTCRPVVKGGPHLGRQLACGARPSLCPGGLKSGIRRGASCLAPRLADLLGGDDVDFTTSSPLDDDHDHQQHEHIERARRVSRPAPHTARWPVSSGCLVCCRRRLQKRRTSDINIKYSQKAKSITRSRRIFAIIILLLDCRDCLTVNGALSSIVHLANKVSLTSPRRCCLMK